MKKYLGIVFALVLALSLSLVTAVPAAADLEGTTSGSGENEGTVVITSLDIEDPYTVGTEQGFSVQTISPDASFDPVRFNFVATGYVKADITSFQYLDPADSIWKDVPLSQNGDDVEGYFGPVDGFPMTAPYDVTTEFKVTFATAKTIPVTISLVDMPEGTVIKSADFSLEVVAVVDSTIAITAPGAFSFGTFAVGDGNTASGIGGTVTYYQGTDGASGWTVTAMDNNQVDDPGKMLRTSPNDSHPLTAELLISGTGAGGTYFGASGVTPLTYTGSASGSYTFDAKQSIASDDFAGTYNITIKFVGTLLAL